MKTILIPIWQEKKQYHLNIAYVNYVREAGYQPIMAGYEADIATLSNIADGLLLSGGGDIDTIYYGEDNVASFWPDPNRDAIERRLYWAFVGKGKPIFGICRGFQLIFLEEMKAANDEFLTNEKAETVTSLEYRQHFAGHSQSERVFRWLASHRVYHNDRLYDLAAADDSLDEWQYVNSMHHQGVKWLSKMNGNKRMLCSVDGPIVPIAYAPAAAKEPIILEAFTVKNRNVLAVQWHPEELGDVRLLWNIFGEPVGAKREMRQYSKEMKSRTAVTEESNELETS